MNTVTLERTPAEIYDEKFVPALFAQWGPIVARLAGVERGMKVLDVGCGTGACTLAVAEIAGSGGKVTGLDANPQMLAVARRKPAGIVWREGTAEKLPFEDNAFDAVVSQFAFMFFEDRSRALEEMRRVVKPGGGVAVAVCGDLNESPGYSAFARLLDRLFGQEAGDAFRAPFVLGDATLLKSVAQDAGIDASVERRTGQVRFQSIGELVSTERACVWTLGGVLDDYQFERLRKDSEAVLAPFTDAGGKLSFEMPALILTFGKPAVNSTADRNAQG